MAVGAPPRLAVLRALGLGDLLTVVPALRALRRAFPQHRLLLAAPAAFAPLVLHERLADELVDTDLRAGRGPAPLRPLPPGLRDADVAVNLHGRGPQSSRLLADSGCRTLYAFAHPDVDETRGGPAWRRDEHEVERWCRLLRAYGVEADPDELDLLAPPDPPAALRGVTVVHPGAATGARRWPPDRWAAVAAAEAARGRTVVVTGGPDEVGLARDVAHRAALGDDAVLAGRTDVLQLTALVAAAGRVVCGDTGVAHLATATRTPSVVLFGPTPPSLWGPPPSRPWHRTLWTGATGDQFGDSPDPSLLAVTVEDVLRALEALPPAAVAGSPLAARPAQCDA